MKASVLAICVLFISSTAFGGWTTVYTTTYSEYTKTVDPYDTDEVQGTIDPISWTYDEYTVPTGYYSVALDTATLDISSYYYNYPGYAASVAFDSVGVVGTLPSVGSPSPWFMNLLSPTDYSATILDGALTVTATQGGWPDYNQLMKIDDATLYLKFECVTETEVWVDDPEPPIPAPGALMLGSLGAGLVGWLRRRIA